MPSLALIIYNKHYWDLSKYIKPGKCRLYSDLMILFHNFKLSFNIETKNYKNISFPPPFRIVFSPKGHIKWSRISCFIIIYSMYSSRQNTILNYKCQVIKLDKPDFVFITQKYCWKNFIYNLHGRWHYLIYFSKLCKIRNNEFEICNVTCGCFLYLTTNPNYLIYCDYYLIIQFYLNWLI